MYILKGEKLIVISCGTFVLADFVPFKGAWDYCCMHMNFSICSPIWQDSSYGLTCLIDFITVVIAWRNVAVTWRP